MTLSQVIGGILACICVIFIASVASNLKRFLIAVVAAFLISVAVYYVFNDLLNLHLPGWIVPIFMIIATIVELRRESREAKNPKLPEKAQ